MRIGEFAAMNQVTTKMLRHYDAIGLLEPCQVDPETGYRQYEASQSVYLGWIRILKNLGFPLETIRQILNEPMSSQALIQLLVNRRIEIMAIQNDQLQKKIQIDRLITLFEKEGFTVDKTIHLLEFDSDHIHEIKKNMPNMELFLDHVLTLVSSCSPDDPISILRFDIAHFKRVNDDYGYEVGDRVIVACYEIIQQVLAGHTSAYVIGRAGGDEFVLFAQINARQARSAAEQVIDAIRKYDYALLGCRHTMASYIGVLTGQDKKRTAIRRMIDLSLEILQQAKNQGPDHYSQQDYSRQL